MADRNSHLLAAAAALQVRHAAELAGVPVELVAPLVDAGVRIPDAVAVTEARLRAFPTARSGSMAESMLDDELVLLQAGVPTSTLIAWHNGASQGRVMSSARQALDAGAAVPELLALPVDKAQQYCGRFTWAIDSGWTDATLTGVGRLTEAGVGQGGAEVFAVLNAGYPVDDLVALSDMGVDLRWQQWSVPMTEPVSADPQVRRLVLLLISVHEVTHAAATTIAALLPSGAAGTMTRFLVDGMPLVDAAKAAAALDAPAPAPASVVAVARPTATSPEPRTR